MTHLKIYYNIIIFVLLGIFIWLCALMIKICLSYFPWSDTQGFLALKQDVVHFLPWQMAFKIHVVFSSFILLAGFTQFWPVVRQRFPVWHRRLGWLYILTVLGFAAPSGLVMAFYAAGGLVTQVCFIILGLLWMASTLLALQYAVQKNWSQHRNWMIRSFALSLSALSLRSWKLILYQFAPYVDGLTPKLIYQLEAWLGWVINLLIAELIIYYLSRKK